LQLLDDVIVLVSLSREGAAVKMMSLNGLPTALLVQHHSMVAQIFVAVEGGRKILILFEGSNHFVHFEGYFRLAVSGAATYV